MEHRSLAYGGAPGMEHNNHRALEHGIMAGLPKSQTKFATMDFRIDEPQSEFDVRFYETILRRNPNQVEVLRQLVDLLAAKGNYERVLELDQRLVRLRPNDCFAMYNLACSLSVLGQTSAALKALEEAIQLGYDDFAHLEADSDLDAVRRHPGYKRIFKVQGLPPK